ncbi:hypothetical protein B9479_004170 [Cryptococcus floricola]|uniref:Uncharacterized protein n=1 Tax=Cryptococcus floricola TaxID=2591691 RepID=A0A5D3AYH2_9TREE|nr:hypothetical protein B9479_004170 [Cryptococcus floricola]
MSFYYDALKNLESRPDEAIKVQVEYTDPTDSRKTFTSYLKTNKDRIDLQPRAIIGRHQDTNAFDLYSCEPPGWRSYTAPCESLDEFGHELGIQAKTSMVPLSEVPVDDGDESRYEDEKVFTAAETEQAPEEEGDQAEKM